MGQITIEIIATNGIKIISPHVLMTAAIIIMTEMAIFVSSGMLGSSTPTKKIGNKMDYT